MAAGARTGAGPGLYTQAHWLILGIAALLPIADLVLPQSLQVAGLVRPILIFAVLGMGLNVVTGFTGLLNLGVAAFMAIGVYTYAILTCDIYPFQWGFWGGLAGAMVSGMVAGLLLGLPTLRLRGDYLAIVTLGFGEMVQDSLKNLDAITKGTQGINPLPPPTFLGYAASQEQPLRLYYLLLGILAVVVLLTRNLENSRAGRTFISIREDELAAKCMGINPMKAKLLAFVIGACLCSTSGALWGANLGSSGEPGNYDFQLSVLALCIVIVGGMGSVGGVLLGSVVMMGFNSIILVKLTAFLTQRGLIGESVFTSPANWKYLVFGLALILMMRFRPEGLLPSRRVQSELHEIDSGLSAKPRVEDAKP
ncbi:MAG: branched-chain amino acid ABC transporter permease [Candidatus Hydrogenedentes bacterium]|nr:branched-chain amino acid ABC transporter permease [Candidatus Hydrogenedentota bacterium]